MVLRLLYQYPPTLRRMTTCTTSSGTSSAHVEASKISRIHKPSRSKCATVNSKNSTIHLRLLRRRYRSSQAQIGGEPPTPVLSLSRSAGSSSTSTSAKSSPPKSCVKV